MSTNIPAIPFTDNGNIVCARCVKSKNNTINTNPTGAAPVTEPTTPTNGGEKTFTQAEVDALVAREKAKATAKATKGMPSEDEMKALKQVLANLQINYVKKMEEKK